jgi:hypothetical protein
MVCDPALMSRMDHPGSNMSCTSTPALAPIQSLFAAATPVRQPGGNGSGYEEICDVLGMVWKTGLYPLSSGSPRYS